MKTKIDFNPEYSNNNLCSDDDGGCGYDMAVCLCDFLKSYHEKSKEKDVPVQETPTGGSDLGGRS